MHDLLGSRKWIKLYVKNGSIRVHALEPCLENILIFSIYFIVIVKKISVFYKFFLLLLSLSS